MTSRSSWLPANIAPNSAEEQQRQQEVEERRARVAPEHPALEPVLAPGEPAPRRARRAAASSRERALDRALGHAGRLGGQLEVDVLEARPRHAQLLEPLAARQRVARSARAAASSGRRSRAPRSRRRRARQDDAVARGAGAQLARRALGEDPAVLDDRHAVGQRLRLVEVVRGQQDGLAELAQRRAPRPRRRAARRVEAGGRLVEEDSSGSPTSASARSSRRCWPPESVPRALLGATPRARRARSTSSTSRGRG